MSVEAKVAPGDEVVSGNIVDEGNSSLEAKLSSGIETLEATLAGLSIPDEVQAALMQHVIGLAQDAYRLGSINVLKEQEEERRRTSGPRMGFSAGR